MSGILVSTENNVQLFKAGWSNFCTLVGHFSKLFEFAGLSRLKIPIFVPKSGCSLKKKKKVFTWNRSAKFLFSFQNQVFSKKKKRSSLGIGLQNSYFRSKIRCSLKKKKKKVFTWNRSPKFLFWRKIIAFSKKKLRLLLLIDKTCAKLICGMRPASP